MEYSNVSKGTFIKRLNRFCATVNIDGVEQTVHVKNTGRLKELLFKGNTVYFCRSDNPDRKTLYDMISAESIVAGKKEIVNIDSQAANDIAHEWLNKGMLFGKNAVIKREVTYGKSRFDFYIEYHGNKAFLEVKGCTLNDNGTARFPDAPTERGVKHVEELTHACAQGYDAYILFIIQMKGVNSFSPNDSTHKAFGNALRDASSKGVKIIAVDCVVTESSVYADKTVPVVL